MPFGYKGCGGNGNKFISEDQCFTTCPRPADLTYFSLECELGKENGELFLCKHISGKWPHEVWMCPTGYECIGGWPSRKCCNTKNRRSL
ncbi:unnamed protein product [Meloidogyne enterolobii]|uniref:Uncharacterized protein n=1 Tax=Meloidogyne enterolobii TaxID=390850 RepID=A0ACB0Z556_MELEN